MARITARLAARSVQDAHSVPADRDGTQLQEAGSLIIAHIRLPRDHQHPGERNLAHAGNNLAKLSPHFQYRPTKDSIVGKRWVYQHALKGGVRYL